MDVSTDTLLGFFWFLCFGFGSTCVRRALISRSARAARTSTRGARRAGRLLVEGLGGVISDEVERQPGTVFRHEEVGRLWRNPELFESIWVIYYGRYGEVIE